MPSTQRFAAFRRFLAAAAAIIATIALLPSIANAQVRPDATSGGPGPHLQLSVSLLSQTVTTTTVSAVLQINNPSTTIPAFNIVLTGVATVVQSGSGAITVTGPHLPNALGKLEPSTSTTVTITLSVPTTVSSFTLGETFTFQDSIGDTFPDSYSQLVVGTVLTLGISPASLTFSAQNTGTTSTAQSVTLTNTGTAPITIKSATLSGANSSDFALSANTCSTLASKGATCSISITFTPAATGPRTATLTIADTATSSAQTVTLSGTGQSAGGTSRDYIYLNGKPVAIENLIGALAASPAAVSPTDLSFSSQNLGTTTILPEKASYTFSLTFTPTLTRLKSDHYRRTNTICRG